MKGWAPGGVLKALAGLCLIAGLSACAAVVAGGVLGGGGVIYEKGRLSQTLNASVPRAHAATVAALKDLHMPIIEDRHDSLTARMKSRLATGEDVRIGMDYATADTSKVSIRIGVLGDRAKSLMIFERIRAELKRLPRPD